MLLLGPWETAQSNPEKLGLEIVGDADDSEEYSFDQFVVWKDATGQLYYASDSGCSCPTPFENYKTVESLTKGTVTEIHAALDQWASRNSQATIQLHRVLAGLR
jgi:hypothetical protein